MDENDGSPIGYERVCKKDGKEVPADEIVKAYEASDGEFVYLEDADFAAPRRRRVTARSILDWLRRGGDRWAVSR